MTVRLALWLVAQPARMGAASKGGLSSMAAFAPPTAPCPNLRLSTARQMQRQFFSVGHPLQPGSTLCGRHGKGRLHAGSRFQLRMSTVQPKVYDEEQLRLLDSDKCILVNERDEVIGSASKKYCHLMTNIDQGGALHRAFSVFLFSSKGELLLQKRSSDKILFPDRWTNSCCSHPLHTESELDNPPCPNAVGVRRAAVRKLEHELGIPMGQVPMECLNFMTRVVYKAAVGEDDTWGEHEVDYILVGTSDAQTNLNTNEVSEIRYVARGDLEGLLESEARGEIMLSPWFRLIAKRWLPMWWDALLQGNLESTKDSGAIHSIDE